VDALIAYAPDVVVFQGSSNDYRSDSGTIASAATDVYQRVAAALPGVKIIVLGPVDSPGSNPELMNMIRAGLVDATSATGVQWVDANAEGWLDITSDFADPFHPNNSGHEKVAERLVPILTTWRDNEFEGSATE
jgi:lysophospholipase L1-like esterase